MPNERAKILGALSLSTASRSPWAGGSGDDSGSWHLNQHVRSCAVADGGRILRFEGQAVKVIPLGTTLCAVPTSFSATVISTDSSPRIARNPRRGLASPPGHDGGCARWAIRCSFWSSVSSAESVTMAVASDIASGSLSD